MDFWCQSILGLWLMSQGWPRTTGARGESMIKKEIVSVWLPDVIRVTGPVVKEMVGSSWPLRAWTEILRVSGLMGIWSLCANVLSRKLPSAPESSSAWQSNECVVHFSLTGRRVDDGDEVFSAEIPPDSSLTVTIGFGLLLGTCSDSVQPPHNIGRVPGISVSPSPPGKAELALPAWARDRR